MGEHFHLNQGVLHLKGLVQSLKVKYIKINVQTLIQTFFHMNIYIYMVSEPSAREVGSVLGVLAYPRIGSSVPRSVSLAG